MDINGQTKKFFTEYPAQTFKRGEILLSAGDTPKFVYYLGSGLVRQSITSPSGDVMTVHFFKPGSFFPLISVLRPHPNEYDLQAYLPSLVYPAPIPQTIEFLHTHPDVMMNLTGRLLDGLSGLSTRLGILTLKSTRDQVIHLLVYLAKSFGEPQGKSIHLTIPLSHREIATWIGTSRETASLQMENLARQGLIRYSGRQLYITDLSALTKRINHS